MDYEKHYKKLIERSKNRILEGYVEKHHILPRCLGGKDDKENIAILTPEEHFVAHQLLLKLYPGNRDLIYASQLMTFHPNGNRNTNKLFGWIRKQMAIDMSYRIKKWHAENEHPRGMLGKTHNVENIEKITAGIKKAAKEKRIEIFAYNLDGSFYKKYDSINECANDLNTNPSNVKYTADGRFGHCKGKQIKYQYKNCIPPYVKPSPLKGKKKTPKHIDNMKKAFKNRPTRTVEQNIHHSNKMKEYHARKRN